MRVCHVTILHPRFDQRILFKECRSLAQAGHDVHLIAPPADKDVPCPDVTIHTGPKLGAKWRTLGGCWRVYRLARREVQADVYHFHDFWLIPFGLLMTWFGKKPVIMDVHEEYGRATARALLSRRFVPRFVSRLLQRLVNGIEAFAARRLAHTVTVVDSITNRFRRVTPRVSEVRNYVKAEALPDAPPSREEYLARRPILIHQGTLGTLRGSHLMLDAMRVLKDRGAEGVLWVVDRFHGQQEARRQFLARIEELDIADRVEVKPAVTYDNLGEHLRHARVGLSFRVMPPGYEDTTELSNIPTKLFEYMGFGLPIVANDVNFHTDFIRPHGAGLLTDYEPASAADAMARLLQDPDEAYRMGCAGFEAYRRHFTWKTQEKVLLEVYRAIDQHRRGDDEGRLP